MVYKRAFWFFVRAREVFVLYISCREGNDREIKLSLHAGEAEASSALLACSTYGTRAAARKVAVLV
jgi:hypothetical protein